MITRCEKLYQELLDELKQCRANGLPFLIETEYCFHSAAKYNSLVRQELSRYQFPSQEEEIYFFKIIKPKFVVETEYASLLNFAGNFCPSDSFVTDVMHFWNRQMDRLRKFKQKHAEFYIYYTSGNTNLDVVYYTRTSPDDEEYAFDKTSSNYDTFIGQLIARERYALYAEVQLQSLKEKNTNESWF